MTNLIEKHPTLPIIIRRFDSETSFTESDPEVVAQLNQLVNSQTEKVYYLVDLRGIQIGFSDLMSGGGLASKKDSNLNSPNIIETLIVVPNRLAEVAVQGLRAAAFGHLRVQAFRTMDDALEYVKQQTTAS